MVQDFHLTDVDRFVSAGMDNCVKIWSLRGACSPLQQPRAYLPLEMHYSS